MESWPSRRRLAGPGIGPERDCAQTFANSNISGQARVHLGNVYIDSQVSGQRGTACVDSIGYDVLLIRSPEASDLKSCRNQIFLSDPKIDRASLISAKGERVRGTCEWIREDEKYRSWRTGETQLLWITGGPGKGKTILSIFLTQQLEEDEEQTIYYFCVNDDKKRSNAAAVLRGLIWHTTEKWPQLSEHLLEDLDHPKKVEQALQSPEYLWSILMKLLQDIRLGKTFCVLDGLDELDEDSKEWLVPKLISISHTAGLGRLKLVIVSRHVLGLEGILRINLDPDNDDSIGRDIQLFISNRARELSEKRKLPQSLCRITEDALMQRAEGTFLWVGFAMAEISRQRTPTQIKASLVQLPRGLPGIYRRILLQMDEDFRPTGLLLLRWVTMAFSPLSLPELAAAMNAQASEGISVEQAIRDQIEMCGPILAIREGKVSLVHQSAKDYLMRTTSEQHSALTTPCLDAEESHADLASRCLLCIKQSRLLHQSVRMSQLTGLGFEDQSPAHSPLLRYAISSWPEHARLSPTNASYMADYGPFFDNASIIQQEWWGLYVQDKWFLSFGVSPLTSLRSFRKHWCSESQSA